MLIQNSVSIGGTSEVANLISGSQFEFLPFNALLEIGLVASATGIIVNVTVGTNTLLFESAPSLQNRFPVYPDDYSLNETVLAGSRLVIKARNTTGGALTVFYAVKITPL